MTGELKKKRLLKSGTKPASGAKIKQTLTRASKPTSAGTVRNNTVGRTGSDIKGVSSRMKMTKTSAPIANKATSSSGGKMMMKKSRKKIY